LGPSDLHQALAGLPLTAHPNLLVGMERIEDAGVYKLTDELAIIQTLDFFTPIVDDPFTYGQIAAANALSDIYAMGGKPLTAMNIVCFPIDTLDISVLREILRGGLEKMREAGVVLLGGHSVDDRELKYGLSVTGTIHPAGILRKEGSRPGDQLVLTKPLGTGIISTALKRGKADPQAVARISASMTALNQKAAEIMLASGARACTDITGFGLLGHAAEMVADTDTGMVIYAAAVPVFPETRAMVELGMLPGGLQRNRDYIKAVVTIEPAVPRYLADILFDPQTSGGLLISVPPAKAPGLLARLHQAGIIEAALIGEVTSELKGRISVKLNP
jgi:selenide, water dikinase